MQQYLTLSQSSDKRRGVKRGMSALHLWLADTQYHTYEGRDSISKMRLIDTTSLQFREVNPSASLRYAILSHRWEEGQEISFQEMLHPNQKTGSKSGYQKIKKFCKRAFDDGIGLAWVDTCCINKESSAELTEAINSMYSWYEYSENLVYCPLSWDYACRPWCLASIFEKDRCLCDPSYYGLAVLSCLYFCLVDINIGEPIEWILGQAYDGRLGWRLHLELIQFR